LLVYCGVLEELRKAGNVISAKDFEFFVADHDIRAIVARAGYAGLLR